MVDLMSRDPKDALKSSGMSQTRFRNIDRQRDAELTSIDRRLSALYHEQQRLFAEVEKASEESSAVEIYGAIMSVMNIFDRVLSRRAATSLGEPEVVAAGMKKFIDRLYDADDSALETIERLSANLLSQQRDKTASFGAKTTRAVVLGRFLSVRLQQSAPLCAYEAQWLASTLLSDLELLTQRELKQA
jgi:hypothetical protein